MPHKGYWNDSNHEDAMTRSSTSARRLFVSSTARLVTTALFILLTSQVCSAAYYGKFIGKLSEFHHGVSGEVYAVDGRTLYLKDFTYDGEGPTAWFYVGTGKAPNGNGIRIRDERGTTNVLKKYQKKGITLTLPEGKTLNNIKWFYVWCDDFAVNFGDVRIPRGFDYPRPQKIAALDGVHGVSSEPIVIVDAQTLLIPGFSYDGEAPDAKFWVGPGAHPSPQGVRVPDENGRSEPLRRYERKTIVLTLPGDLTVHELGHFGVWCEAFTVDFGHVQIPANLNVPPSLKMLGVSPQSKLNCEVLEDSLAFEVRWAVAGDSIVVQLVGKLDDRQYMSFGLSATPERSVMVGGDVAVAWVDKQTLQGYAIDYFLDAKSQCSGGRGSCPDTRIQPNSNSVRLLNAAMVNGYSIVTYQRPLKASDELDRRIRTNGSQAIIWAIGPLNERDEVSFHSHYLKTDKFIEFGRPPAWNCPMPDGDMQHIHTDASDKQEIAETTKRSRKTPPTPAPAPKSNAWEIPPIECHEPEDGILYAQLGPTGGKHGYPAITGHVGWGISWYINGLLIPVINVVRGHKYTFIVEGGDNPEVPARYHPFYITDDPVGGYEHKTAEEKAKVKIFAGVSRQGGKVRPTGVGRLCNWIHDPDLPEADTYTSFGAFQRSLNLKCGNGEPGFIEWTPDANTPDTVYYQCFTHRYLGWKINVVDHCDEPLAVQASDHLAIYVEPPKIQKDQMSDLEGASSTRVASKVTHAPEFYDHHRNLLHHHHNQHHHHHANHHNHQHLNHEPYSLSQLGQTMRYNIHNQHANYPSYMAPLNNNPSMSLHPKLISSSGIINSNNKAQLTTTTRLNAPPGLSYGNVESYELANNEPAMPHEQQQVLPMRNHNHQSIKQIAMHHRHYPSQQIASHHTFLHPSPGPARTQLNLESMHRPPHSLPRPHRNDVMRSPLTQSSHGIAYYRDSTNDPSEIVPLHDRFQQFRIGSNGINATTDLTAFTALPTEHHRTKLDELDQETRQTSTVPISVLSPSSSNQPSSNLVTDQRPIMSYGQMKYAFSHPGTSQYVYSRPSQSHPTIVSANSHKTGQKLMIIRRPIVQQLSQSRPILGSMLMSAGGIHELPPPPTSSSSSRPLMERKKAIYSGPSQKISVLPKQNPRNTDNHNFNDYNGRIDNSYYQVTKMTKFDDNKQRDKIEAKISTNDNTITLDRNDLLTSGGIKPARNTGFDPDSIVIESGFKPIIRRQLERDIASARSQEIADTPEKPNDYSLDVISRRGETNDESYVDETFEPMFVPSPLDRNGVQKQRLFKKLLRAQQQTRKKTRLVDLDDMEMAADRLDSYYLPPAGENTKFLDNKRIEANKKSTGTLVTFDGKLIDDPSLPRSVQKSDENNKRSRSRLTSETLSKTPQFGKFKGALPPQIPGEVRIENTRTFDNHRTYENSRTGDVTRLVPLNRSKRSAERRETEIKSGRSSNATDFIGLDVHEDRSTHNHSMHDHSNHFHQDHNHADYATLHQNDTHLFAHHHEHDHSRLDDEPSTGEMLIANIHYLMLTIILYYTI